MKEEKTIEVDVTRIIEVGDIPKVSMRDIVKMKPEGLSLVKQINNMEITNQTQADAMNIGLGRLNKVIKFVDTVRIDATKPLRDATAMVNEAAKTAIAPFIEAMGNGKTKIAAWRETERRRIEEAERKRLAEEERRRKISLAKGGTGESTKPVPQTTQPLKVTDSTRTRKRWTFEIEDETKIPREFLAINSVKINEAIRNGARNIEGLKIFQKEGLVY